MAEGELTTTGAAAAASAEKETGRVEAFSDGVFAVAIFCAPFT